MKVVITIILNARSRIMLPTVGMAEHPQKPKICICSWYSILEPRAFLEVSSPLYYVIPD
jgi:hypothetical protein